MASAKTSESQRSGFRRRVDRQRNVGQQEVERRSAAIEHDGVQQVAERSRGDQPGDGLVLVEGFPAMSGNRRAAEQRSEPDERKRRPEAEALRAQFLTAFAGGGAQGREP